MSHRFGARVGWGAGVCRGKLAAIVRDTKRRVRDRSRAIGLRLRAITRTIRRRSWEAKAEVLKLTAQTGELLKRSVKELQALLACWRGTCTTCRRELPPGHPPRARGRCIDSRD